MSEKVDDFLAHNGVKGMKWGRRKKRDDGTSEKSSGLSPEQKTKLKRAAVVVGTASAVALLVVGTVYAAKHMKTKTNAIAPPSSKTKTFVADKQKEPVGVVHASKPKNQGFKILASGGLDNPLREYDKAGFSETDSPTLFSRYGENKEKIAARFIDPEGRKDRAGRVVPHEVILPESLAKGVKDLDEVIAKVWPLIKDSYEAVYDQPTR